MAKAEKVTVEKIVVSATVEWAQAQTGVAELKRVVDVELDRLQAIPEIKNAYSPITWLRLCRSIHHVTEGMTAVRLSTEGMTAQQINASTGIGVSRIAGFKAWNTRWLKAIRHTIAIKWAKEEERLADIAFLRSVGISVEDAVVTHE
jgi:hypothetical protein